jgi:hypothetical protein
VKLARLRKPKAACFPSYVKYRLKTNTTNIIYTHKYIQNMYSKMELTEETKEGGKGGKTANMKCITSL